MKLTSLQPEQFKTLTHFSINDEDKDKGTGSGGRGSGRILILAIAFVLLIPGAAFAGSRDQFPGNLCPGKGCPDNARPKQEPLPQ